MTINDNVLRVFNFVLLAILFLFFLRVLRAVWVELSAEGGRLPRGSKSAKDSSQATSKRGVPRRASLIGADGRPSQTFDLESEATIGRGGGCRIPIDDSFASAVHARLFMRDGHCFLEDLGSTNGTLLNGEQVSAPVEVEIGDEIRIGGTSLELGK